MCASGDIIWLNNYAIMHSNDRPRTLNVKLKIIAQIPAVKNNKVCVVMKTMVY